jgi:hypothetical protein
VSKNLWIKQLDFVSGTCGTHPSRLMKDSARLDKLLGKKGIRSSEKLVVAFLGQSIYFRQAALEHSFEDAVCRFVSHTQGDDPSAALRELHDLKPDIVIVFRPELFSEFETFFERTISIGYFTEPLPSKFNPENDDLTLRYNYLLSSFPNMRNVFDLFIGYNSIFAESLEKHFPIWSYFPIPIRDDLILPSEVDHSELSIDTGIFVGRTTPYRSQYLEPLKHKYGWTVLDSAHIVNLLPYSVALNLHNNKYKNFENRNFLHMALGQLVISEPQSPTLDLSPGFTHLEFSGLEELLHMIENLEIHKSDIESVRLAGKKFVQRYSSSNTWGKLLTDMSEVLD